MLRMFDFRRRWSATLKNRGQTIKIQEQTVLISRGGSSAVGTYRQRGSAPPPPPGRGCTILLRDICAKTKHTTLNIDIQVGCVQLLPSGGSLMCKMEKNVILDYFVCLFLVGNLQGLNSAIKSVLARHTYWSAITSNMSVISSFN